MNIKRYLQLYGIWLATDPGYAAVATLILVGWVGLWVGLLMLAAKAIGL